MCECDTWCMSLSIYHFAHFKIEHTVVYAVFFSVCVYLLIFILYLFFLRQAVSRPAIQQFMNYSSGLSGTPNANGDSVTTRVAADHDTHQDFQPTSKSSDMSFSDIVAQVYILLY